MIYRGRNLMEAVRLLAALYPNAIYNRPISHSNTCFYSRGVVVNGPPGHGCIIGQAFRLCGFEQYANMCLYDSISSGSPAGRHIRTTFGLSENTPLVDWCCEIQYHQDQGTTWGEAVRLADRIFDAK